MAMTEKSIKVISTIGRSPVMAAPAAAPEIAASEIGQSRTRSGPNSSNIPTDVPKSPPKIPTSSPINNTFSSRRISSDMARIMVSRKDIVFVSIIVQSPLFNPHKYLQKLTQAVGMDFLPRILQMLLLLL